LLHFFVFSPPFFTIFRHFSLFFAAIFHFLSSSSIEDKDVHEDLSNKVGRQDKDRVCVEEMGVKKEKERERERESSGEKGWI
jgi:hypothetical protein